MKKAILSLTVLGSMLLAGAEVQAQTNKSTNNNSTQKSEWKKSTTGSWQGKREGTSYWYKRDSKSGTMTSSTDNKKWNNASDNVWTDYDGKWYRIQGDNLEWSTNNGSTWSTSPNRYWRGSNGTWYGFDDDWTLWTGGTSATAPDFSTVNSNTMR